MSKWPGIFSPPSSVLKRIQGGILVGLQEKPSKGAEKILLAQIKQEFSAPAEAIEQYIDLVEQFAVENNLDISSEIGQIKEAEDKLLSQYEDAFKENTATDKKTKTNQEYSELRHNLRTPLNAIIGYSEILIEDFEEDLSEECIKDLNTILSLSRETETAIERFVDFIKGDLNESAAEDSEQGQIQNAESLFRSLGDIDYSLDIDDHLKGSDVLIVDDNKTNCEVLERRLSQNGLSCRVAFDGTTAIKEVEAKTPDLILLDVMLPDINGLELLKRFRKNHERDELPIIMVSAFNDVDSTAKCIKLGASDYLPKPLNGTILMAKSIASLEAKYFRAREQELLKELNLKATTCPLTGIFNRQVVFDKIEDCFDKLGKKDSYEFALLSMDIDFFKSINDTYGHPGGDEVLKAVAHSLRDACGKNVIGRVGGEEFIAIIENKDDLNLQDYCEKIRQAVIDLSIPFQDAKINITISGGVINSSEVKDQEELVNLADERLYKAKEGGRNQFIYN
jgi:diguanylate cyclase (GGDEF)-like protein